MRFDLCHVNIRANTRVLLCCNTLRACVRVCVCVCVHILVCADAPAVFAQTRLLFAIALDKFAAAMCENAFTGG